MQRNSEWRRYASSYVVDGVTLWLHPSIPAQSSYVADFLREQDGVDTDDMSWLTHLFYILHGFLIDFECADDTILSTYIQDIEGLSLQDAYESHIKHPLLSYSVYELVKDGYKATRDKGLQELATSLDVTSDVDEEAVEKKD